MISHERFAKAMVFYASSMPRWAPDFRNDAVITLWYSFFGEFTEHQIAGAFRKIAATDDGFPSIAKLKRVIETGMNLDESQVAEDVAGRIEAAIGRFGSTRDTDRVQEYIGEVGWVVVSQVGGWLRVCEVTYDQLPSARRQWRELAAVVARKAQMGCVDTPPSLNASESKIDGLIGDSLKSMTNVVCIGPTKPRVV